jgi:hypothetical protein
MLKNCTFADMLKSIFIAFLLLLHLYVGSSQGTSKNQDDFPSGIPALFLFPQTAFNNEYPSIKLLQTALAGYEILIKEHSVSRPGIITIIDFSLPSDRERLWVLDLNNGRMLFHCLVSHGRNSGELMAESFSNQPGSNSSSPGFYATAETYIGKHGLSLALDGLETGINDKARERAIVIHGADYVSTDFIKNYGRLGRSLGCPAVPVSLSKEIIETIKGGSCLFIYVPNASYTSNSQIINKINSVQKG